MNKWDLIRKVIDLDHMRGSTLNEFESYARMLEKYSIPLGVSIWDFDFNKKDNSMIVIEFIKDDIGDFVEVKEEDFEQVLQNFVQDFLDHRVKYFRVSREK